MAAAKEIRSKITSVKKTQKITRAMELVAASKMRKAQDRMSLSRPYASKMLDVISHLTLAHPEYKHPYIEKRKRDRGTERIGLIVVSSDRGLCGGLNTNLFKNVLFQVLDWQEKNNEVDYFLLGTKSASFLKRFSSNIQASVTRLGDAPSLKDIIGVIRAALDAYDSGNIDVLYVCYNHFVNTMKQEPTIMQLLPVVPEKLDIAQHRWDYIYEPDSKELLNLLLTRYVETQLFQAVVENIASEQAARMVAMKSATENAGQIIDNLKLSYNKVRQAVITREIAEIVSGADAV